MKNLFKLGFLAFALTLTVAACNSNKTEEAVSDSIDSTADVTIDSLDAQIDTVDSAASAAIDSVKN